MVDATKRKIRSWFGFVVCMMAVAVIWTVALPRWSQESGYQVRQQLFDSRSIDPSAMFYTELDCLDRALDESRRAISSRRESGG